MSPVETPGGPSGRQRNLYFLTQPHQWPQWPYLPVVRRCQAEEEPGLLFDALGACGVPGHSATVFLTNLFLVPSKAGELLALPKEVFDTPEELADAGWCVD
jgi:hypothetical protein